MSNDCQRCDGEVQTKDNRGWYRDTCQQCIREVADAEESVGDIDDAAGAAGYDLPPRLPNEARP